ncbi:SN protein, partial [Polypterus senegalus]
MSPRHKSTSFPASANRKLTKEPQLEISSPNVIRANTTGGSQELQMSFESPEDEMPAGCNREVKDNGAHNGVTAVVSWTRVSFHKWISPKKRNATWKAASDSLFESTHCRKEWRVTRVPEKLSAVRGSCVVIPCMVYLPAKGVAASRITAIWRMADHGDVFNSRGAKVLSGFMGRTALLGNVADQNCSLQIQNLRHEDNGSYYFRIEVKGLNNYSFINNMVTLQVTDTPETPTISHLKGQKVGDVILLSCSTFHWCPSHPPTMTWNYTSVNSPVKHTHVKDGMWQLFSLLYFVAVKKTLGSVVTCTVEYPGGARARASVFLQIKYKYVYVAITAAIVLLAALTLGLLYFRRWRKIRGTSCATRSAEPNSDVSTTIYEKPEDFKYEEQNKEEDYESMQQGNLYENIELSARNSKCATDSNDEASE